MSEKLLMERNIKIIICILIIKKIFYIKKYIVNNKKMLVLEM